MLSSKVLASKNIVYNLAAGFEVFMILCRRNLEEEKWTIAKIVFLMQIFYLRKPKIELLLIIEKHDK